MPADPLHDAAELLKHLKPKLQRVQDRAIVAEVLQLIRQHEASAPPADFDAWCRVHAPRWKPSRRDIAVLRLFLACGQAHRDEIAMLIGSPEDPATNGAVRKYFSDLRKGLEKSKATATVQIGGHDGVYHTHDPSIQRLNTNLETPVRKVLRFGH